MKKHESTCSCCADSHGNNHPEKGADYGLVRLGAGAVLFAAGIVLERVETINGLFIYAVFALGFVLLGADVIFAAVKNLIGGRVFDENFLMSVAAIGAFAIGDIPEAVGVMLFYQVGEYFQARAVRRSRKSIASLMGLRPDFANLKQDGSVIRVNPESVNVGDIIVIRPGEKVPLDGVVISGTSSLDTSSLTGESVPRQALEGDSVLSGCVNQNGLLTVKVTKPFGESTASKIIDLVENAAEKKAPAEKFISKFARYYTPFVVALAALITLIPPLILGGQWFEWLRRGLILLVISCPCALVLSIPLSFFAGIGAAAGRGILVKGGNFLESLAGLEIAVFDKTGTLTKGVFEVTALRPASGFDAETLLELAAAAETFSSHPIARSIARKYNRAVNSGDLSEYSEIPGLGVTVKFKGRFIAAGSKKLMEKMGVHFEGALEQSTETTVYIAAAHQYAGCIVISDEIKSESGAAIAGLKSRGIKKTVMLSGDTREIAGAVAQELGIDEFYGDLLPQEKVEKLESLLGRRQKKGALAFVGDGVNDAPALALADIGIAMGGLGSDAAIEAADVVFMTDEVSKLNEALDIAGFTRRVVIQNVVFALGVKGIFLFLGTLGAAGMWEAVFADVGVCLLAILNAARLIKRRAPGK